MGAIERRSDFLGMPFSTATYRLNRSIIFQLLQRHNENVCFVCSKDISNLKDLSIEHKLPWEGRDPNLFWDFNNIAFSHIRCNRPHIYKGGVSNRKVGPEGTAWCPDCSAFISISLFRSHAGMYNGLYRYCKTHEAQRRKTYNGRIPVGLGTRLENV